MKRKTLDRQVQATGIGVRFGQQVTITLVPADAGHGLQLRRTDHACAIPIGIDTVVSSAYCTAIGSPTCRVDFVEHLMAALHAAAITDLLIEVIGAELPMFDGSALPYWELLHDGEPRELDADVAPFVVTNPIHLQEGDKVLSATPAETPLFAYELEHPHPLIGTQSARYSPLADDFAADLAPARTWGTYEDLFALQQAGLLAGGTEENALVVYPDHLSETPRWPNAFARHKLLDLYGDLYLLGAPVVGGISTARTGHADNLRLARRIAEQSSQS